MARDHGHNGPAVPLLVDQVKDRREVHGVGDDPGARGRIIECAQDDGVGQRDIGLKNHFARPGADQRGHAIAEFGGHRPPGFLPGSDAAGGPGLVIILQRASRGGRGRTERIADQVIRLRQDGKLVSPRQQTVIALNRRRLVRAFGRFMSHGKVLRMARTGLASQSTRRSGKAISS